ncbi:MAG: glycoside hydrolase family 3 protein [Spirochaetaceae bacterium]|nr:glycoside hydrolase family 3 protein [Spirochaetaceae bacterium]
MHIAESVCGKQGRWRLAKVALCAGALFLTGFEGAASASASRDFWNEKEFSLWPEFIQKSRARSLAEGYVDMMGDEEILSQVLMVGYAGTTPSEGLLRWIGKYGIGGIKIFGWNAENTTTLAGAIEKMQSTSMKSPHSIPALVATDQEGGWIRHVKGRTSESPGNMAIGATGSSSDAFKAGYLIGKELRVLGITMNFAPDIDLATNPSSTIIGPRAFSDDPAVVARLGNSYASGSLRAGVIPTAKHYPGHGATSRDSHGTLPVIDIDSKTFEQRELKPFSALAQAEIPAMMSGHLAFPRVTGNEDPASLSEKLITGYLRGKLRYKGLVITDDLYMVGALGSQTILETCIKALMAGNDMLLLSTAPELGGSLWNGLLDRYRSDTKFRERVKAAATTVLTVKFRYLRPLGKKGILPQPSSVEGLLPDPEATKFFNDLARRSASVIGSRKNLPFRPKGKVMIAGPFDTFISRGCKAYPNSISFNFSFHPDAEAKPSELKLFKASLTGCKAAIICVANPAGLQFAEAAYKEGLDVAIVSVLSPAHVKSASWSKATVAVYHYAAICLQAGLDVLHGDLRGQGRVPISMSGQP